MQKIGKEGSKRDFAALSMKVCCHGYASFYHKARMKGRREESGSDSVRVAFVDAHDCA